MIFRGAEDHLNPITSEDVNETTLGGYAAVHGRAAAMGGSDGEPYTVAIETEHTAGLDLPWAGYLVFVRWARTGTAVMGHLETGDLIRGGTEAEVREALAALPLEQVKQILDAEILRRRESESL